MVGLHSRNIKGETTFWPMLLSLAEQTLLSRI